MRVERIVNATNEVELGWTAPGTDYDSGSAAFYQIRCYTDRSALNDSSSAILVHSSLTPQPLPAGTWQKAMAAFPWPNQIFYYAIVAVDFAGLRGKVSNIVPVYIEEPPPPSTTITTNPTPILPAGEHDGNNMTRSSNSTPSPAEWLDSFCSWSSCPSPLACPGGSGATIAARRSPANLRLPR